MNTKQNLGAGTACLLHEIAEYEEMEREFGEKFAISAATKAAQKFDPSMTENDMRGAFKFIKAARTSNVNVAEKRQEIEEHADRLANRLTAKTLRIWPKLKC